MAKGRSILKVTLFSLNIVAVAALLASYLAGYISPERWWVFAFFGLAYPAILLVNMAFVIFWLVTWKKFIFVSLLAILAGYQQILAICPIPFLQPGPASGHRVNVITYNIHSFYGTLKGDNQKKIRSGIWDLFKRQNADIICTQEFSASGDDHARILEDFARKAGLTNASYRNYERSGSKKRIMAIVTFARHPMVNQGYFEIEGRSAFAIFTDLAIGNDTVRVYNLHLQSIRFGKEDYRFYSNLTEPDTDTTRIKEGSLRIFMKLRKAFQLRARQVDMLSAHLARCRYPVIIAGDFNDPPSSYTYHRLTRTLSDSFIERGRGLFQSTYRGKLPSYRIDQILHSGHLATASYSRPDVGFSDHFPVAATLFLKP